MEHFIDIYKKKPQVCIDLLDNENIKINLKVDGKPFQVVYNDETNEIEFHGRSGNETTIGPLIDDYTRLFSKPVNDAIAHLETRTDICKKYQFLTFEVIDNLLLLTAVIDNNDKFIDSADEIKKIANELETNVMPTLWEGKLSNEQKDAIVNILESGIVPEKSDLIKWCKDMFGTYKSYPTKLISAADDFIEGIVFFFPIGEKVVEYKIVDPTYRQAMKDRDDEHNKELEEHAKHYEIIYNTMNDWVYQNAEKYNGSRIDSLSANFVKMMSDAKVYNKLMNAGAKIKLNTSKTYTIQTNRTSAEVQKGIRKHGNVYKQLFELFMKTYYKGKKRGFIISNEFQAKVNEIIEKI